MVKTLGSGGIGLVIPPQGVLDVLPVLRLSDGKRKSVAFNCELMSCRARRKEDEYELFI